MPKKGAPPGNKNAGTGADNAPFKSALNRAIAQDNAKRVRAAAEQLLDKAATGEPWALNMLADRLDGKPTQSIDATVDSTVTVEIVRFADQAP